MIDRNIPVTEDELHAYVDNELPAERRADVESWLAAHPDDAERVQSWRTMAELLHARYDSVADEAVPKRLEIERLVRQPRKWIYGAIAATLVAFIAGGWDVRAPELTGAGLKLVGGRLLPGPTGPASFLMYESATGERFTVYTAKASSETTQMRYSADGNDSSLYWADRGVGYVVSGGADRGRLTQIAQAVYDQMDKKGG
jgi:anti-sigma factor RsiW